MADKKRYDHLHNPIIFISRQKSVSLYHNLYIDI